MSSDVHAKWMNSLAFASSAATSFGARAMLSFIQYSTALTSWFVTASIALIRPASASPKSATRAASQPRVSFDKGDRASRPASESAISQATSTCTRRRMKAASDSNGRNASVFVA
jgi:hypothetical protein